MRSIGWVGLLSIISAPALAQGSAPNSEHDRVSGRGRGDRDLLHRQASERRLPARSHSERVEWASHRVRARRPARRPADGEHQQDRPRQICDRARARLRLGRVELSARRLRRADGGAGHRARTPILRRAHQAAEPHHPARRLLWRPGRREADRSTAEEARRQRRLRRRLLQQRARRRRGARLRLPRRSARGLSALLPEPAAPDRAAVSALERPAGRRRR